MATYSYLKPDPYALTGIIDVDVTTNGYKWYFYDNQMQILNWSVSDSKWSHPSLKLLETQDDFSRAFGNIAEFINVKFNFLGYIATSTTDLGYIAANKLGSDLNISFSYNGTSNGVVINDNFFGSSTSKTAFCNFPDLDDNSKYNGAPGDVWLNYNNIWIQSLNFESETNGFALLIHEILHGLGLKHPHDGGGTGRPTYASLDWKFNDRQWITVMSYDLHENGGDGAYSGSQPIGPMIMDAIALQYLYGESVFNAGNTVYDLRNYVGNYYNCQWDSAGNDTLNGNGLSYGIVVDLGSFSAFNGVSTHHAGYITSVIDSLWIGVLGNNPDKWTWLWGEYENVDGTVYNDVITGNDLNNELNGGSGDDYLTGGAGDDIFDFAATQREGKDTLEGGLGNDVYVLDSLLDIIVENSGEGVDQVYVPFNYSLNGKFIENIGVVSGLNYGLVLGGNEFDNVIRGGENDDTLSGLAGNDTIYGNDGNDILWAGAGKDSLYGGTGNDKIYSRSAEMAADFDDGANLIYSADGNDTVYGGNASDSIYGGMGDDSLLGLNGNDSIGGDDGNDYISGSSGNDTLNAGNGIDSVYGGDGDDLIYSRYSGMESGSEDGANLIYGDDGNDTIYGGNASDSIYGGMGNDSLLGSIGNDSLGGNDGNDYISGSSGNDTLNAGNGIDSVYGGDGDDLIYSRYSSMESGADDGANLIYGDDGNDTIYGGNASDSIYGGMGDDSLLGSSGNDSIGGNDGNDYISGSGGNDTLNAGNGIDSVYGGDGDDLIYSRYSSMESSLDDGANYLDGGKGDDVILGGAGADTILGGEGNDELNGGAGNDSIDGGDGQDTLVYLLDSSNYLIEANAEGYTVEAVSGNEGKDIIKNVEFLKFLNKTSLISTFINQSPTANSENVSTPEDTAKTGTLTATDVDSTSLTFAKEASPANGTVTVNTNGTYTYTPTANFNGTDSFTFKANDGYLDSAAATVSITVTAVNDAPIATVASITTNEDTAKTGILTATDVDSTSLTFAKEASPANGTVTVNTNGTYTYTPTANFNGSDSFTFKVNDGPESVI